MKLPSIPLACNTPPSWRAREQVLRLKAKLQQKPPTKPELAELLPREFIIKIKPN